MVYLFSLIVSQPLAIGVDLQINNDFVTALFSFVTSIAGTYFYHKFKKN